MRNNKLSEKKELYYKFERSLVIFIVSIILFCMSLFAWIAQEKSAPSRCTGLDYDGSCMNVVADMGVVRFVYFAPILFISFFAFLISGMKVFLAKKKLGSDFTKVRKAAKNSTRNYEKKEYYDDML